MADIDIEELRAKVLLHQLEQEARAAEKRRAAVGPPPLFAVAHYTNVAGAQCRTTPVLYNGISTEFVFPDGCQLLARVEVGPATRFQDGPKPYILSLSWSERPRMKTIVDLVDALTTDPDETHVPFSLESWWFSRDALAFRVMVRASSEDEAKQLALDARSAGVNDIVFHAVRFAAVNHPLPKPMDPIRSRVGDLVDKAIVWKINHWKGVIWAGGGAVACEISIDDWFAGHWEPDDDARL